MRLNLSSVFIRSLFYRYSDRVHHRWRAGTSLKTIVDPHNMLALLLTPQRPSSEDR